MKLFLILNLLLVWSNCVRSLSVSKIDPAMALIPWTSNNNSEIEIRAIQGCYMWKFEENGFIKIENNSVRTDSYGNKCIDSIKVYSFWPHENIKGIFTIKALNLYTGEFLRSEVHVAKVESIKISTSSKRIRLGSLESLYVIGFDRELNTFTTLSGINIVWELDSENIISEKKKGEQITLLGSSVGSTNVKASIFEQGIKDSKVTSSVKIFVEDPFKITPYIRRAPFGSIYDIQLIREDTFNLTNIYIYNENHHLCIIDEDSGKKAQIIDKKRILISNFDESDVRNEFAITTTCIDTRVEGSSSTSLTYISYPRNIFFAIEEDKSAGIIYKNLTVNEFVNLYYIEGEQLITTSRVFNSILYQSEVTITKDKLFYLQIKLKNYDENYLSVPLNSVFSFKCLKGCELISVNSIDPSSGIIDGNIIGGFVRLSGVSTGYCELSFKLLSIGEMNYYSEKGLYNMGIIERTIKINIIEEVNTTFTSLPLVLYPGEQIIDIKEKLIGGRGPFYFCSTNPSILRIDFQTGILKTNHNIGDAEVIVYDSGTDLKNISWDNFTCEEFKKVKGLNINVIVTYIKKFDLILNSSKYQIPNVIYTSVSQKETLLQIKAIGHHPYSPYSEKSTENFVHDLFISKLDTLDILKLFDPCEIIGLISENGINDGITTFNNTKNCLNHLTSKFKMTSFVRLNDNYNKTILTLELLNNEILVKIKDHGSILINDVLEFGLEFVFNSTKYKKIIVSNNLLAHVFNDISFTPIIDDITLSYFENSEVSSNVFYLEKDSSITFELKGGINKYESEISRNVKYTKYGFNSINKGGSDKELNKSLLMDFDSEFVQFSELNNSELMYVLKCKGFEVSGYINFEMSIIDNLQNELFSMKSKVEIFCKDISHFNVFWLDIFSQIGKYTCNSRGDNCRVFHFDSTKTHKFISLGYDRENNLLLSYNNYRFNWRIDNCEYCLLNETNQEYSGNAIELQIDLKEKSMRDIDIIFEVFSYSNNESELENYDFKLEFKVFTKGIFTKPPGLISPNMIISEYQDIQNFHFLFKNKTKDHAVHDLGHWYLLEGEHQFGIIFGTNNYRIYLDDGTSINYGLCENYSVKSTELILKEPITQKFLQDLDIYYFCLDSNKHLRTQDQKIITIYIEDQLILPNYVVKKKIIFGKLGFVELFWFDRFFKQNYQTCQLKNFCNFEYYVYDNKSEDEKNIHLIKVPYQYIWFLKFVDEFNDYNDLDITNTLPCLNKSFCIVNNKAKTLITTILSDENGNILEPWQNTNFKVEIEYKITNFDSEEDKYINEINSKNLRREYSIEIKNLMSFLLFEIQEIQHYNVEIEIIAKAFYMNEHLYSNSLILNVYESIEIDSGLRKIALFPYGSPLKINFTGGPVKFFYQNFEFQWYIFSEKKILKNINEISNDDILLIRDENQLIVEPLGKIGEVKVYIKYFLIKKFDGKIIFKSLIYSNFINVYVDIPDEIELYSPDSQYLYLDHPKPYLLRALNKNKQHLPYFHSSQLVSSLLTSCTIIWTLNKPNDELYKLKNKNHEDIQERTFCICSLNNTASNYYKDKNIQSVCKHQLKTNNEYSIFLYPIKTGYSLLNVELICNFGRGNKILNLSRSQKITVIKPINFIKNSIWIIRNSLYYFNIPKNIILENENINLIQLNNSQLIYFYTKDFKDLTIKTKENRFISQMGNIYFLSTAVVSEPKVAWIILNKYTQKTLLISLLLMNSMGIPLFPTTEYCKKIRINLSSLQNDILNIVRIYTIRNLELPNLNFSINIKSIEESNINNYCSFAIEFETENVLLSKITYNKPRNYIINKTENTVFQSMNSYCLLVQVYLYNETIGSQSFCYKSNDYNTENQIKDIGNTNIDTTNLIYNETLNTQKYEINVASGSKLYLNPLKWKLLNFIPRRLSFCVIVNSKILNFSETQILDEISNITNIPKSIIYIQNLTLNLKLINELDLSTDESLYYINIDRRVDPFELWYLIMNNSLIISKSKNLLWIKNNSEVEIFDVNYLNPKEFIWNLYSQEHNIKILENEILIIPSEIKLHTSVILKLGSLIEIKINIIPTKEISKIFDSSILIRKEKERIFLNTPYSFSIYNKNNNENLINPLYNNIYYSSPLKYINCVLKNSLLKEIYNLKFYWSIMDNETPYIIPSCRMEPLNKDLTNNAINYLITETSQFRSINVIPNIVNDHFDIVIMGSHQISKLINLSIPINFHPILLKSSSSIQFSDASTILNQHWELNSYNMEVTVPYNINFSFFYKLPLNINFWFGYPDTQLIAYSIRGPHSDKYLVNFVPNKLQGIVQIIQNSSLSSSKSTNIILNLPLDVSLEFLSNGNKHKLKITFVAENIQENKLGGLEKIYLNTLIIRDKIRHYSFLIIISITTIVLSIIHFSLNKSPKFKEKESHSPFRRISTQKL